MSKQKVRGQDIVEIFANSEGFKNKCDLFNLSEWYGFINANNKVLRAKLVTTAHKNGTYNVNGENLQKLSDIEVYCIIQQDGKFVVIKINKFDEKGKFILNSDLKVINGSECENVQRKEFEFDDRIYKIQKINQTIYGIRQRVNNEFNVDEDAIKEVLENALFCTYCGVSQDQINRINKAIIDNNLTTYGLTSRNRGSSFEIDPKKGYTKGNIATCCYWCNNAKTDTFLVTEFKDIARGINIAWNQKIKSLGILKEHVCFPENSDIWTLK